MRPISNCPPRNEEEEIVSLLPSLSSLLNIQQKRRPEIRIFSHAETAAEKARQMAWQPFIPSLSFIAGYTRKFDPPMMNAGDNFSFGAVLSWDVGIDWWKNNRNLDKATAAGQKTVLENIEARKQMELQVSQMYATLQVKEKEILLARSEIKSAEESLRTEESKYQQSMATQTDLLNASLSLKMARMGFISAQMEYLKILELLAATIGVKKEELIN